MPVDSTRRCCFCAAKFPGKIKLTPELTTSKKIMLKLYISPELYEKRVDRLTPFAVCESSACENSLFFASFFIGNFLFFKFLKLCQMYFHGNTLARGPKSPRAETVHILKLVAALFRAPCLQVNCLEKIKEILEKEIIS